MAATMAPVAIRIEFAAGAEREVRFLALGNVTFRPRQLRANQRTMDRPIVALVRTFFFTRLGFQDGFRCFRFRCGCDLSVFFRRA